MASAIAALAARDMRTDCRFARACIAGAASASADFGGCAAHLVTGCLPSAQRRRHDRRTVLLCRHPVRVSTCLGGTVWGVSHMDMGMASLSPTHADSRTPDRRCWRFIKRLCPKCPRHATARIAGSAPLSIDEEGAHLRPARGAPPAVCTLAQLGGWRLPLPPHRHLVDRFVRPRRPIPQSARGHRAMRL